MYVRHHNTSFISSRLRRIRLFNVFPIACPTLMLGGLSDGPCRVSSVRLPFSSVPSEDLCSFLLPGCALQFCFLFIIAVPPVARDVSVHCSIAPPAAVRLLQSEGRHFSQFTVLGFLPSTAVASVVPRHGSVHLRLKDFFSRFTPLDPPCSI